MSEESEQVWENISGSLRRLRRRRVAMRVGASLMLCLCSVFLLYRGTQITDEARPIEVVRIVEPADEVMDPVDELRLAVLVYDGERMRFELMDGEQLGVREMELSLQPVVMSVGGGMW